MKPTRATTSAVLFCDGVPDAPVPIQWFDRASKLFVDYHLSPVLFTAFGGGFEFDDCYVLANSGGDLTMWNETIKARGDVLVDAIKREKITHLLLDSPRPGAASRSDWRANVSADACEVYAGIEESLVAAPHDLMTWTYAATKGIFDVRYGFGYKLPISQAPDCYARGIEPFTLEDFRQMLRDQRDGIERPPSADRLWHDELLERKRHLKGLFRGAYPVNVLSEAHVRRADLLAQPIGKLSELDTSLWLWELSEQHIPQAEAMLEEKRLLVRQAGTE